MTRGILGSMMGLAVLMTACGGGDKKETTKPLGSGSSEPRESSGAELIDEQKFEEIRTTFERKVNTVSRCHPVAVEAGEIDGNDRVTVTLALTIQPDGTPKDVRILERSKVSATLEACVVEAAERWLFTELPRPLETSHIYSIQSF